MGTGASAPNSRAQSRAGLGTPATGEKSNGITGNRSPVPNYHKSQAPPPPTAPDTRKEEIFKEDDFKHVDDHVINLPPDMNYGTFKELVSYLTSSHDDWDEIERVRAIFRWVTSVDVFSVKVDRQPPKHSPMEYFLKIQNNMGNHAHLMAGLCQMAGIHCNILSGMNKSAAYEIGKKADRQTMGAQWNAVYVAGNWRIVDAFWASACVVGKRTGEWALVDSDGDILDEEEEATEGETQHRINEFYFLPNPDQFIWTHFPDETKWQLLPKPITLKEFEDHYYVRERFHILGMTTVPATKMNCVADTKDGEVEFVFGLPPAKSGNYRYKYMLYRSRSAASESKIDLFLDRFVLFEQREDLLRFALRFPIKGNFKLDIYGLDIEDGDVFDLCCTYIINCAQAKPNCLPLPDCPPLGWGPVAETKAAGLTPVTHNQAEVVSKDGHVEIRLAKERALAFHQLLKHSILDEATLSKYSVTELEGDEAVVYLRLPQKGEYALKLFAQELNEEGPAQNVLNYLINCSNTDGTGSIPFPNVTNGLLGRNHMASEKFGVKALSHPEGKLETQDGRMNVDFQADSDVELVCEMHTNDGKAYKKMSSVVTNKNGKWNFALDMPVKGEYSLNVFARRKDDPGQIHSVHTYIIKSGGREGADSDGDDGEEVDTTIPTDTVETSDGEVMIPVPPGCTKAVAAVHRRNGNEPPDPSQIEFFNADDMDLVKVRLKDYGEYMLNLYDVDENGNTVKNVAKYQINRKRPNELYQNNLNTVMEEMKPSRQSTVIDSSQMKKGSAGNSEDDAKRTARKNVQNALDLKDARHLEQAIKKYLATGADEKDPFLVKARQQLAVLKAKAELMEATQARDIKTLEKALENAKKVNSNHELDLQIALAARLRDHLSKIEKLRHAVLNMESKTISELRSYSKPPDGVHQCMIATFLLLGHQLKELKEWQKVQALLGKTGKESVMRKISNFDAQSVPLRSAQVAKRTVQPYNKEQIRDVSAGAATFYIWALGMIEEVESYGGSEQNDQLRLKK